MNNKHIARELVAVARELVSAPIKSRKPKYTTSDLDKLTKQLEEFVKRGGRDYGNYQFSIKMYSVDVPDSVRDRLGQDVLSEAFDEEAQMRVQDLCREVKQRFRWVRDCGSAGRSGGWFVVMDDDSTMDSLEQAYGPAEDLEGFSKLRRDERGVWYRSSPYDNEDELWQELTDEVKGAVEEGQRKVRDLNEIEKMVKEGVTGFKKDMESERWWQEMLA